MKKVFVLTRVVLAFGGVLLLLLPRGLTATATPNNNEETKTIFDVSRASRITCQAENVGCTVDDGSFGSIGSWGFSDPFATGDQRDVFAYYKTTAGHGDDNYLEFSSCWDFDCTAACDPSCSCVNMATQQACPTSSSLVPVTNHPAEAFHLEDPHIFYDLQDIRLECTESHTKCVIQGFEGCGGTIPRYNLYNDRSGLFIVDDVDKGDTVLELRGCNSELGTAECDAGCQCHDLATNEPCKFTTTTAVPPLLPVSKNPAPKIVFDGLQKATLSCNTQHARCDEMNGSHVCGSSSSGDSDLATTSWVRPAAFRVDRVQRWPRGFNSVTFEACWDYQFAMECDASCTCVDASTGRPCHCTDESDGQACSVAQDENKAHLKLVAYVVVGGLVVLGVFLKCFCRSLLRGKKVGVSSTAPDSIADKEDPTPSCEIEKISLVSDDK